MNGSIISETSGDLECTECGLYFSTGFTYINGKRLCLSCLKKANPMFDNREAVKLNMEEIIRITNWFDALESTMPDLISDSDRKLLNKIRHLL